MDRLEIEKLVPITGEVSLVLFCDCELACHDAELVVNTPAMTALYEAPDDPQTIEECRKHLVESIGSSHFHISEDAFEVRVSMEESLFDTTKLWCEKNGITMERLVHALLRFITEQQDSSRAVKFMGDLSERQRNHFPELRNYYTVTISEFEKDFDTILEKCIAGSSPIVITEDGEPTLLLFEREDYWRRFGTLHAPTEKAEIEAEAMRRYLAEQSGEAEAPPDC